MTKASFLLVTIVAAALVLSAVTVLLIAIPSLPGTYAGSLGVDPVDYRPSSYGGVHAPKGSFMVLNVTVANTGTRDVNFNRTSWAVLDPGGVFVDSPSTLFNTSLSVPAHQSVRGTIVFDDSSYWVAYISVSLPNGKRIMTLLTTTLKVGLSVGVTGDGTNWSLLVISTPLAVLRSNANLSIISSTGTVLLPPTSLAALDYSTDKVAYIPSTGSTRSTIAVGDRLHASTLMYPSGSRVELSSGTTAPSVVTLQG